MAQAFAAPPPPPMHHPMPNHQQGGAYNSPPVQTFAGASQQARFVSDNAREPPVDPFNNMHLDYTPRSGGMQRNRMTNISQYGEIPVSYEGFRFRKAPEAKTWSHTIRTDMSLDRTELLNIVKKVKSKNTVDEQYRGLRSRNQRMQIEELLAAKRSAEIDPRAEWVLACVKDVHAKSRNGWGPVETSELQIILKRHGKQKSTHQEPSKNVTTVANPPGLRVNLNQMSNAVSGGAGINLTNKPGQPIYPQQHEANGQHRGLSSNGPSAMQNGFQGPHHGPSAFPPPHAPINAQNTQHTQRMPQQPSPRASPNEGRTMNNGQGPQMDSYNPSIPMIQAPLPQSFRPPPIPQVKQQKQSNLAGNANMANPGPFQGFDNHHQKPSFRPMEPERGPHDRRRDSGVRFDSSDGSNFSEGTRYSSDGSGRLTPISIPTTISSGAQRRKVIRSFSDDPFELPRRHHGDDGRSGQHMSGDSFVNYEAFADLTPNHGNGPREHSRYPGGMPPQPYYKDQELASRDMDGTFGRWEDLHRNAQDSYERARREEAVSERMRVSNDIGRNGGHEHSYSHHQEGRRDRGGYH